MNTNANANASVVAHPNPDTAVPPWPDPVDGALLLNDLRQTLNRFVILPPWAAEALALWVLHTYAFHLRDVTVYIGVESPEKRCGKTTLVTLLSELVHHPEVAANISPSAFFRVIEENRPTLLIDEADTLLPGNDELRGILNSGYSRKTAYVVRVAPESRAGAGTGSGSEGRQASASCASPSRLRRFSSWCPKLISTIGRLPDTLADRCVLIRMQRKTPGEACERLRNLRGLSLRRCCLRFVADYASEIAAAEPVIPGTLNDRAGDIWEPLLALADLAGGGWPGVARQAAVQLSAAMQDSNPASALLSDLLVLFGAAGNDRLFSRDLVAGLNAALDRPWAELRNGRPITELWLAQQLRPYGIRPCTVWQGSTHAKGYLRADFEEVFQRYIPGAELERSLAQGGEALKS